MSISQWTKRLASLLAVLFMTTATYAQHGAARPFHPQMHQPFIDPLAFDPDYEFFAPAEIGNFGNGWQAKTGWFGKYDRMHLFVSRPELEQSHTGMDATWGHRVSGGYMTSDNHGWSVEGFNLSGPGYYDQLLIERVNRFNDDDDPNGNNNQGGGGGGAGGNNQQPDAVFPVEDRNNPLTDARTFESLTSINVASMNGFELNKTFRLKRLHNGSYLEPFFGFRYHVFNDFHRRDSYRRLDPNTGLPSPGPPFGPNATDLLEEIIIRTNNWENHMVGGQLGLRWFAQKPRWQLSSELRFFAAQNFQQLNTRTDTDLYLYSGIAIGSDVQARSSERALAFGHNDEFVWGLDVRAEAAYELTRDVSLSCGVQVLHHVQGIARGDQLNFNEEDLTMVGATFGVQVNR